MHSEGTATKNQSNKIKREINLQDTALIIDSVAAVTVTMLVNEW
jgi:hypothetical protein